MLSRNKAFSYASDDAPMCAQQSQETVRRAEAKKMLSSFWEKTVKVSGSENWVWSWYEIKLSNYLQLLNYLWSFQAVVAWLELSFWQLNKRLRWDAGWLTDGTCAFWHLNFQSFIRVTSVLFSCLHPGRLIWPPVVGKTQPRVLEKGCGAPRRPLDVGISLHPLHKGSTAAGMLPQAMLFISVPFLLNKLGLFFSLAEKAISNEVVYALFSAGNSFEPIRASVL